LFSFDFCFDDHASLVISRSASVRPKHLFDPYFDHDYFFKLPFAGSGMPNQVDGVLLPAMSDFELSRVGTELY
jgi:esterase/lipase superfamily enzyme